MLYFVDNPCEAFVVCLSFEIVIGTKPDELFGVVMFIIAAHDNYGSINGLLFCVFKERTDLSVGYVGIKEDEMGPDGINCLPQVVCIICGEQLFCKRSSQLPGFFFLADYEDFFECHAKSYSLTERQRAVRKTSLGYSEYGRHKGMGTLIFYRTWYIFPAGGEFLSILCDAFKALCFGCLTTLKF